MSPIEHHRRELKRLQHELSGVNRQRAYLRGLIDNKLKDIKNVIDLKTDSHPKKPDYIGRDVNLCLAFIKLNPGCATKKIVSYLNTELQFEPKRWYILDTSAFSIRVGQYLKKCKNISTKDEVIDGRRTNTWTVK